MSQESTTVNYPSEFKGFAVSDPKKWATPELISFEPKKFTENDIDIEIECNGICGSDLHTVQNDWSPNPEVMACHGAKYGPKAQIVGHEVVGKIIKIGKNVTEFKIGQRVGVGAQAYACLKCQECLSGNEQYCSKSVYTYAASYEDGYVSQGGYASHMRVSSSMVFPIPDALKSEYVAPLLCGGLTVFSPIKRNIQHLVKEGKTPKVGVIGIGGLGHMAIMIAKAYGCDVTGISRSDSKKEDAFKMGATDFIATGDANTDWKKHFRTFDLLVNCSSTNVNLDLNVLASTLKVSCNIVTVGVGALTETLKMHPFTFIGNGCGFAGSLLGSKSEASELMNLAVEKNFRPWVETLPISEAGVSEGLTRLNKGDVKYRFTLVDYHKFFNTGK